MGGWDDDVMYKVVPYATPCEYPDLEAALEPLVTMLKVEFDARAHKKATKTLKQIIICQTVLQSMLHRVRENKPDTVAASLATNGITAAAIDACFVRQKAKQKRARALYKQLIVACMALCKE